MKVTNTHLINDRKLLRWSDFLVGKLPATISSNININPYGSRYYVKPQKHNLGLLIDKTPEIEVVETYNDGGLNTHFLLKVKGIPLSLFDKDASIDLTKSIKYLPVIFHRNDFVYGDNYTILVRKCIIMEPVIFNELNIKVYGDYEKVYNQIIKGVL
ncbi:MAG: hypothetical protein N2606_04080 [Candidatus Omnitrophica bacterium]|nr:hypothetical protein [Candidatus Omnitrophota bacterium]